MTFLSGFLNHSQIQAFAAEGYLVIDQGLTVPELAAVQDEFESLFELGQFKKAQVVSSKHKMVRGDWTYWLSEESPLHLRQVYESLKSWQLPLNQNFYCGVTHLEAHLAYYPEGLGYEKHWDQAFGRTERKVSFVLYLNSNWKNEHRGELILYSPHSDKILTEISPVGGRLVIFRSDLFPHEVKACLSPRRSLTGWFRSDAL